MNKNEIKQYLEENEVSDVEFIREEEDMILARMFYYFDEEEIAAAENYEESLFDEDEEDDFGDDDEEELVVDDLDDEMVEELDEDFSEEDYEEEDGMIAYLSDIAVDHIGEVLEDLKDDLNVDVQYIRYYMDEDNLESFEVIAMFYKLGLEKDIEEELEKIDL